MRLFPLILAVICSIDCLLAVWTAERPTIGSGHHLLNTLNASSIQSHCITTDGWRDGLIMNTQRGTSTPFKRLLCSWESFYIFTLSFILFVSILHQNSSCKSENFSSLHKFSGNVTITVLFKS